MCNFHNVSARLDNAFGNQEAAGEFRVVSRRAHRDCDASPTHANLQGFFAREPIFSSMRGFTRPMSNHARADQKLRTRF